MDFYRRVALVCEAIPRGKVATYGQIALLCGMPKNARQVGYALNREKAGRDVPAFRVVNHQGVLSGAQSFSSPDQQRRMLEADGIQVMVEEGRQKVDLRRWGWKNTIEEALELQRTFEGLDV